MRGARPPPSPKVLPVKLLHTGVAAAAVAGLMLVPLAMAQAAPATVVVTPDDPAGWVITPAPFSTTSAFVAGPRTLGTGSVQFGPITAADARSKFIIGRAQVIPSQDFGGIAFDYYIDPAAANKAPQQYYLNIYTDSAENGLGETFYECRYDYVATVGGNGWHTLTATAATAATAVAVKRDSGLTCGTSPDDLPAGSRVLSYALNGGDTSTNDTGLRGGFDNVVVTAAGTATTYDFEPAEVTACDSAPAPGRVGTAGRDVLRGTAAGERFDLLAGDDVLDALGGDDCVLGGDGADRLLTGDGADEVTAGAGADAVDSGAGADIVDAGAGRDTVSSGAGDDRIAVVDGEADVVDCGAGTDRVRADAADVLRNCETVTRVA